MASSNGMQQMRGRIPTRSDHIPRDDIRHTINVPLHRPHSPKSPKRGHNSINQNQRAEAIEKGYFGQTNYSYGMQGEADFLHPGKMMHLDDKTFNGLKVQLLAKKKLQKQQKKKRRPEEVAFVESLKESFTVFDSHLKRHVPPPNSTPQHQKTSVLSKSNNVSSSHTKHLNKASELFDKKLKVMVKGDRYSPSIEEEHPLNTTSMRKSSTCHLGKLAPLSIRSSLENLKTPKRESVNKKTMSEDKEVNEALAGATLKTLSNIKRVVHKCQQIKNRARGDSISSLFENHKRKRGLMRQDTVEADLALPGTGGRQIKMLSKMDRRQTMANFDDLMKSKKQEHKFLRIGEARDYFVKAIRRILIVLSWWAEFSSQYQTMENQLKTFFDMAVEINEQSSRTHIEEATGILFDPNDYKASKEIILTSEVEKILTLPPVCRTKDQILKVLSGLQALKSFAEYPVSMQEKLAKVAWYQEVSPKRVILRQGHVAESFYFILSGFAVVKVVMKSDNVPSLGIVARLVKGQSFGEIALLHHSERTATVESGSIMAMLNIGRDDFLDIFFNMKDGEEPEHVTFCRQIPFLKNWPIDKIHENPGSCMFHFFKRGSIVIADSRINDWIYIVKTGSCRILKKLQAVESVRIWSENQARRKERKLELQYGAITHKAKVDNRRTKSQTIVVDASVDRAMTEFFTTRQPTSSHKRNLNPPKRSKTHVSLATSTHSGQTEDKGQETKAEVTENLDAQSDQQEEQEEQAGFSKSKINTLLTHRQRNASVIQKPIPEIKRRSQSPLKDGYVHPANPSYYTYIELRKLREKDVFGLEDVQFEDEYYDNPNTSVMLVSDGAELIMLSRKLFVKHANEYVRQYVREHIRFFPAEDILQENLQTEVNWNLFRGEQLVSSLMKISDEKLAYKSDRWYY